VKRATFKLRDALHARPASVLVRLATTFAVDIKITKDDRCANAKKILDVLSLGAQCGDEITVEITADDDATMREIAFLIEKNFDPDFVPERGTMAVSGIAIGAALVVFRDESTSTRARGSADEERALLVKIAERVTADLEELVASLPPREAQLFVPAVAIARELASGLEPHVAKGISIEEALVEETRHATTDLIADVRARILDQLTGAAHTEARVRNARAGEVVLVTDALTPSLVAAMGENVTGIVAATEETTRAMFTSHAAILARGRNVPLVFVPSHVVLAVADEDMIVLDATIDPARVWFMPSPTLIDDARARRDELARSTRVHEADVPSLAHLSIEVRANVNSLREDVPSAARGVGLLRTELVFAGRRLAPSEGEQLSALLRVAEKARGGPVIARLFDAGGDKPLAWIPPPDEDRDARGIALLLRHPAILSTQLNAITRAASDADVRVLLPLVRSAADVEAVRAMSPSLKVGAMIETQEAVNDADAIARAADFICIGTNDLTASALGDKDVDIFARTLHPRVIALIARTIDAAHANGRSVTVCGEMAAHVEGARVLVGLGVNAISVAVPSVASIVSRLAASTLDECRAAATRILNPPAT
jgi:phosphotransferase system HPr (HPr) family protein